MAAPLACRKPSSRLFHADPGVHFRRTSAAMICRKRRPEAIANPSDGRRKRARITLESRLSHRAAAIGPLGVTVEVQRHRRQRDQQTPRGEWRRRSSPGAERVERQSHFIFDVRQTIKPGSRKPAPGRRGRANGAVKKGKTGENERRWKDIARRRVRENRRWLRRCVAGRSRSVGQTWRTPRCRRRHNADLDC